jgi:FMN phosphatase YigB (HAD superfamily)
MIGSVASGERSPCSVGCGEILASSRDGSVRGLIVDLANVIYDATTWRRVLWRLVSHLGFRCDYAEFSREWCCGYLVDVRRGRRDHDEALEAFLLSRGLTWGEIDEIRAARRGCDALDDRCRPLPGAAAALSGLSAMGVPVVAWADVPYSAARLRRMLDADGLGRHFRCVLSSFDLEETQPAAACYRAGLDALGLPADQVMFLGHDADHLAAAKAEGLLTAALDFHSAAGADLCLARFADLVPIVAGARGGL